MQPVREVYSLLMPVQGGRIIVPRAAVAEVMGYSRPKNRPENAPDFVLGFVEWQGQKIPLVSYEAARGQGVPELGRRTRVAVVFGMAGHLDPDVFAVVTQGYPYLVRVNENVLHSEEMDSNEPLVLARVRMANEKPLIPDFEKLEVLIAEALGIAVNEPAIATTIEPADELDALGDEEEEFEVGLLATEDDDDATTDEAPTPPADVDLGAVTSFGTETNYSAELDELSGVVADDDVDDATAEPADIGVVTEFGAETNYSVDLGELSEALQDEADEATDEAAVSDDEYAIDLSGLELNETGTDASGDDVNSEEEDASKDSEDDAATFDFSDLQLDPDDDNDEKKDPDQ